MSAPDFRTLLSKPAESIEKPKPLPAGTYHGFIKGQEFGKSAKKETPYCRYFLGITSPGEDVDQDAIKDIDLSKKSLRTDFYLTPDSEYRLVDFLVALGISKSGRSLGEMIPDALNAQVLIEVTQRSSQDGSEIYNDVGAVKAAS